MRRRRRRSGSAAPPIKLREDPASRSILAGAAEDVQKVWLESGQLLQGVHHPDGCLGETCTIHNESDRARRTGGRVWTRFGMQLKCTHDYVHPHPDERYHPMFAEALYSVHMMLENCDGCCQETNHGDAEHSQPA